MTQLKKASYEEIKKGPEESSKRTEASIELHQWTDTKNDKFVISYRINIYYAFLFTGDDNRHHEQNKGEEKILQRLSNIVNLRPDEIKAKKYLHLHGYVFFKDLDNKSAIDIYNKFLKEFDI